jgi:prepilin-type N-terminal cleavage/methylation domain-containing protein
MSVNKGFTLAEVLITLSIIGVVAALTIPTLTRNYEKQLWITQYKATYSILSQAFKMVDEFNPTAGLSAVGDYGLKY